MTYLKTGLAIGLLALALTAPKPTIAGVTHTVHLCKGLWAYEQADGSWVVKRSDAGKQVTVATYAPKITYQMVFHAQCKGSSHAKVHA